MASRRIDMARKWPRRQSKITAWPRQLTHLFALLSLCFLAGCGNLPRANYVPENESHITVEGVENARVWADASPDELRRTFGSRPPANEHPTKVVKILAISGGGAGAAYGAGLLAGWSAQGDRPEFDVVTGVSAGALLAPFAFLGTRYDPVLKDVFSGAATEPLNRGVTPISVVFGDSLSNGTALRNLIDRFVTRQLLDAIALEYSQGRLLFVMTANLDAQRPVVWNMGAIAASRSPQALHLFRQVLLASASVPGYYPPVKISVASPGGHYFELHSDGGVFSQVFIGPDALMTHALPMPLPGISRADIYVLVNNNLAPEFSVTRDATLSILGRAFQTIIKAQARETIDTTYLFAREHGYGFHLSFIDQEIPYDFREPFAASYISSAYALGMKAGREGAWRSKPEYRSRLPQR